ncbi:MAG: VanZ family protein [Lentimonas sp.]|jgi:VanZ family protein
MPTTQPAQSRPKESPQWRNYYWPLLLALAIFAASGQSQLASPDFHSIISKDKLAHFLVFGLLATSLLRVIPPRLAGWKGAILVVLITSSYGGLDELRQSFTPGRSVEFKDWIADTLGACTACVVYLKWPRYRNFLELKSRSLIATHTDQSACAKSPE